MLESCKFRKRIKIYNKKKGFSPNMRSQLSFFQRTYVQMIDQTLDYSGINGFAIDSCAKQDCMWYLQQLEYERKW